MKDEYLSHWSQERESKVKPQVRKFKGRVPGRIWTRSQWDVVPRTQQNSALCEFSASKPGSFPEAPFYPGDETGQSKEYVLTATSNRINDESWNCEESDKGQGANKTPSERRRQQKQEKLLKLKG